LELEKDNSSLKDKIQYLKEQTKYLDLINSTWKILIVDDEEDIHPVTILALKRLVFDSKKLEFLSAYSAIEAKKIILANPDIAIVLLDVVMEDETAGLDLVRYIREELNNDMVRIILRTGNPGQAPEESVTINYDINDYRSKTDLTALSLRTMMITALRSYKAIATIKGLNKEIDDTQKELIYTLGEIAEFRSAETGNHVKRVGEISALLGQKLGFAQDEVINLNLAASMHDLGKIAIDDAILNKPGKLSFEEFEIMKTHTTLGYEILRKSNRTLLKTSAIIAKEHHENFDGSGYPSGLKSNEINIVSRIVALVDVFDALGAKRVYKEAWKKEDVIEFILSEKGKKFDPEIVDLFFANIDEIYAIVEKNTKDYR
jgi:response regulator RpfG family c-di-GMP phosphodiesterase